MDQDLLGGVGDRLLGGNSNWRGPIWFPVNYLVIEALHTYARFFGDAGLFQTHRDWHNLLPFHEYFHGDTGRASAPATRRAGPRWSPTSSCAPPTTARH